MFELSVFDRSAFERTTLQRAYSASNTLKWNRGGEGRQYAKLRQVGPRGALAGNDGLRTDLITRGRNER